MIRNLVFDMGNVLIYYDPRRFIRRAGVADARTENLLLREIFLSADWALMDWGAIDEAELEKRARARLPEALWETARRLIYQWNKPILPMENMEALIKKCKEAGYGIYLLSNATARIRKYWHEIPASELFDGMVVSAQRRCVKPMPEIYRCLLDAYRLNAAECLFVDDVALNVSGAIRVGMQGFVFRQNADALDRHIFGGVQSAGAAACVN